MKDREDTNINNFKFVALNYDSQLLYLLDVVPALHTKQ